tara:strand:- start:284 stop:496 length:213 start_codon:yes stop_codon:yes gene_type:complete
MTNTIVGSTVAIEPTIDEFQLHLADGSSPTIPCTAINHAELISVVAAALHHLIQRVAYLEFELKKTKENK